MSIWGASWVLDVLFLDLGGGYSPSNYTFVFRNFNGYLIKLSHAHTYAHSGKQCPARSWYTVLHPPPPSDLIYEAQTLMLEQSPALPRS